MRKNILMIIILVVIDQIIKLAMINTIGVSGDTITLIPEVLSLSYLENAGGAFGISLTRIVLIGLDIMILAATISLLVNKKCEFEAKSKLGLSLILAGGIGNLIDRIFRGAVIDYLDITQIFNFPIFNFSDICIIIGIIILFVVILINTVKSQENMNEKV